MTGKGGEIMRGRIRKGNNKEGGAGNERGRRERGG